MKSSILLALFLGTIFGHNANAGQSGDDQNKVMAYDGGPALTCLIFKDYGCDVECHIVASAFSLKASGKCTQSACQCTLLEVDNTLEGLFKAKFDEEDNRVKTALKIIREDNAADKILDILRAPFQTVLQTKLRIKEVCPRVFGKISNNDWTPAFYLMPYKNDLKVDQIRDYVFMKLKPVLKTPALQLQNTKYEANMIAALYHKSDEDLSSIVYEVCHTNNEKLRDIVAAHLRPNSIKSKRSIDKEDTFASLIGYFMIDTFVGKIEKEKLRAMKKSPSQKTIERSLRRFQLPESVKNFMDEYCDFSLREVFEGENYWLEYARSYAGSYSMTWKKASNMEAFDKEEIDLVILGIELKPAGRKNPGRVSEINQSWVLDKAYIRIEKRFEGAIRQFWRFGDCETGTTYTYEKDVDGKVSITGLDENKDTLKMYQQLIMEWCDDNSYLVLKEDCILF